MVSTRRITDFYLDATRLRLREIEEADGTVTRKLGQKIRLGSGPGEVACTSVYLDDAEWSLLQALPARRLRKTRHIVERGGIRLAVDAFEDGSLIAEIDDGDGDGPPCPVPTWLEVIREVTDDEQWTGSMRAS